MEKIVVLYINHETQIPLGSSFSLLNLIESVKENVYPIILFREDSECAAFFRSKGIECICIPFKLDIIGKCSIVKRLATFPFRLIRDCYSNKLAVHKIRKIVIHRKINIVHTNSSTIDIGHAIAEKINAKHVWHLREYQNLGLQMNPFLGWNRLKKQIYRSDAVIAISKGIYNHFECAKAIRSFYFPDAVRSKYDIYLSTKKEKYFLICGRIMHAKGQEFAIKFFNQFVKHHPDYRLKVVGSGDENYVKYLKSISHPNVDFEGYQEDTSKYYKSATAYLMCSKNEGLGRTTIEAMFYGCPVLGLDSGGTREIITHRSNGLLFKNIEECNFLMEFIMNHPDETIKMSKKAQHDAINMYSKEIYGAKIIKIYKTIL